MINRMFGVRTDKKLRIMGAEKAPMSWKLRNMLRWAFIFGWLANIFAKAFSKITRIPTITCEAHMRVRRLSEADQARWRALRDQGVAEGWDARDLYEKLVAFSRQHGWWVDYGVVGYRVVTDAGATKLASAFNNGAASITGFNFHAFGSGTNAEAVGDTALQTEFTTQINPDSTRSTGTRSNPAANQYRSVGTMLFDSAVAITEHGLFDAASGVTLWDRTVFAVNNLASGESIQMTHTTTFNSGG